MFSFYDKVVPVTVNILHIIYRPPKVAVFEKELTDPSDIVMYKEFAVLYQLVVDTYTLTFDVML